MSGAREKIIGIDLGTTNSAAAVVEAGRPVVIPSAEGATPAGKMFPSVVAYTKDGQLLVGEPARRQVVTNPDGTVFEIKRKMGTDYRVNLSGKDYSPEQLSSYILQKIKHDAEVFLGYPVKKAVITVPAHFNDNQRQATKDAGEIAGLEVVRIINEPTAASLAYGLDKSEKEMKILVFSFGGGTHDATIMEFGKGVFQVLATSGDTQTGGTDVDKAIIQVLLDDFRSKTGIDLTTDKTAMARLKEGAEQAKIQLSNLMSTDVDLPFIASDASGPKNLHYTLTRTKLEEVARPIVAKTEDTIRRVINDAKLTPEQVDKVILIGGMTRMPLVRKFVEDVARKQAERGVDPMEAVAIGAAIQGAVLAGEIKDILLLDVTPLSLGVETLGGITEHLIEKNATIPTKRSKTFTTAADFQTAVTIHVVQGERSMAADNVSLGMFNLTGIPPAPRGVPQIEVTFDIDANGILTVGAKDIGTGKENKITITASTKLSKEEKERLIKEAETFADQDRKKREDAEVRNDADSVLYTAERTKKDLEGKVDRASMDRIDAAAQDLRKAVGGQDTGAIREKSEALKRVLQEVGASVYQQQAQKQQQGAPPGGKGGDQKVGDADYRVVDEGK
ncbi:MAG: molecular chaperone DnaK [Nitrososphaerota archaeon]|jgi:molecular chaperone DnaK|nr:molecular chaperone DnaK [Nitrososphaerota archaeon]MDG6916577.1 molecular chaperone DnaK [Nitrososphaerota archaeon]MDG6919315.1 molecular chaperone DnaK [Nitrososphaerota archaeon]